MIEYTIRFFTVSPLSSLIPLQAQLFQEGVTVQLKNIMALEISHASISTPFLVELTDSTNAITQQDIADFIAALQDHPAPARDEVLNLLTHTQSIVAIGVPHGAANDVLDFILAIVGDLGDGLFHVEGEGFYQDGTLIVRL